MAAETLAPDWPEDAVEVGRILDGWGIKGWVKVQSYADQPQALLSSGYWFLKPPAAVTGVVRPQAIVQRAATPTVLKVTASRRHGDGVVASVDGVVDRNGADALKGMRIFVSRSAFPKAEPGEYYWVDLIGLAVVNRDGVALGEVTDLTDTGPHSVLRVRTADGEERLIPFVAAYVDDVNLTERRVTVDWGLDY
jgi:16S rRNA processing protein RimM